MTDATQRTDDGRLSRALAAWDPATPVVVLAGAGISAESGIPTFRGTEGLWRVGSRNYAPADLATYAGFRRDPEAVWRFYLGRIRRHRDAQPNPGHLALVRLERALGERFVLVTQNVDGLHLRAGNDPERTWCIHGRLDLVRCAAECGGAPLPLPAALVDGADGEPDARGLREALRCAVCGDWLRPHVLWFDECYDEEHFRFESSILAAENAGLLVVVGSSGATNLPNIVVGIATDRGIPIVVVDPEDGAFQSVAERAPNGAFVRGRSGEWLPRLVEAIVARASA